MQKITIAELDIQQALAGIECPKVIRSAIWHLSRTESLEPIVQTLILSGKATGVTEAIQLLVKYQMNTDRGRSKVNLSDLQNYSSNNTLQRKLNEVLGREVQREHADRSRVFGVKSHVTIPKLLSGEFIKIEKVQSNGNGINEQLVLTFPGGDERVFSDRDDVAEQVVMPFEDREHSVSKKERPDISITASSRHIARHIEKITTVWKKVLHERVSELFPLHNRNYQRYMNLLIKLLKQVFHDDVTDINHVDEILKLSERDDQSRYYAHTTLLCWSTALTLFRHTEPVVLFKELSLIPYRYDVGLGRIDALGVVAINGAPPDKKQTFLLQRLSREKHLSVGHLILKLVQAFGTTIELVIYDWKFAVGDGPNGIKKGLNIIKTKDVVDRPLIGHRNQMNRYVSGVLVSYALAAYTETKHPETIWKNDHFSIHGEIHYFLPDTLPIMHRIELTEDEKKEVFRAQVVENYANAQRRANLRVISKDWLKLAIGLVENKSVANGKQLTQLSMKEVLATTQKKRVKKFIDQMIDRKFVDEFNIVEHVGNDKDGRPVYQMHVDELLKRMESGEIVKGKYFKEHGGKIRCFVHGEKTPSLHIKFKGDGMFKCFGCGIGGHFHDETLPDDIQAKLIPLSKRERKKYFGAIQEFTVPERHKACMILAQRHLQSQFFGSPAEVYLREKRRLEPQLSYKHGAGYGTDQLIPYLLDMEFTYDELVNFGFFNFSSFVKENDPLVRMLKSRGLTTEEIMREGKTSGKLGFPISILVGRVTYPLDIEWIITGFYGRSIDPGCPKDFIHQKTQCNTVPQGGYNITRAMEEALRKGKKFNTTPVIGLTEGPIDVDTFIQRGDIMEFGGLIGANNELLWQITASFEGNIIVALDWDESNIDVKSGKERGRTGQKNTAQYAEYLKAVDFRYAAYDFTEPFAAKHPGYKDMNQFWIDQWEAYFKLHKVVVYPEVLHYSMKKRLL